MEYMEDCYPALKVATPVTISQGYSAPGVGIQDSIATSALETSGGNKT